MRRLALLASLAMLAACNGDEDEPGPCSLDWECDPGQVCDTAAGECKAAAAGSQRGFGRVEMQFDTGEEAYLMAVYAMPTGAAAADEFVPFSLSTGGAAGALTMRPATRSGEPRYDQSYWDTRIAFETKRRAEIDQLITDIRAGRRSLQQAVPRQDPCGGCEQNEMCVGTDCLTEVTLNFTDGTSQVTCDVLATVGVGNVDVTVLLDTNDSGASTQAQAAAMEFAAAADDVLAMLGQSGHTGSLDRNGDGRMAVVFSNSLSTLGADLVGFFDFKDYLPPADPDSTGNEADLLWARVPTGSRAGCGGVCPATEITNEVAIGTLVHEYVHLVNFAVRVHARGAEPGDNEVLWLDEGMAHLMEDLTGYGSSNIGVALAALDNWDTSTLAGPNDSVEQRGQAYTYLRHLVDQASSASNATQVTDGAGLHSLLLQETERGFDHSPFGADSWWQWMLATFATNNSDVTESAANSYDYLATGTNSSTGQTMGFDPYMEYADARNASVPLSGPANEEIDDLTDPFESEVTVSGSLFYIVTGLEGAVTIDAVGDAFDSGDGPSDLQIRAQRVW